MLLKNGLASHFASLPDPRIRRSRKHELLDILFVALCATICGADSFAEIAQWGRSNQGWLQSLLPLTGGIPSHDTLGRVFARLDRQAFADCFREWTRTLYQKTEGEVIPLDGKWVRGSFDTAAGTGSLKMVSAWASHARLVLTQKAIEPGSNETATLPHLLALLDIVGCVVTIDAAGCQKEIAGQITDRGGDYVLSLKGNQPYMHGSVSDNFADWEAKGWRIPFARDRARTANKGHGRVEVRECFAVAAADFVDVRAEWGGLKNIVLLKSERRTGEKVTREERYYLTSLSGSGVARRVMRAIRSHWGIENRLHERTAGAVPLTGCWMWCTGRISVACVPATRHRICRSCVR